MSTFVEVHENSREREIERDAGVCHVAVSVIHVVLISSVVI